MSAPDWGRLCLLALVWGGSFPLVALALGGFGPVTVAFLRVAVAAALLAAVMAALGERFPPWRAAAALAVMGALNNALPFAAIAAAQTAIDAGLAAILNATTPLFGVLVAAAAGADRLAARRMAGVAAGLGGVALIAGGGAGAPWAVALCLSAALSYALASVWGRRLAPLGLAPPAAALGMLVASAVLLLPVAVLAEAPLARPAPGAGAVLALLVLAGLSTAIAYRLYFRLLADVGAVNLLTVTFLVPVGALVLSAVLLGERPGLAALAGLAAILAGLWLVAGRRAA